MDTDKERSKVIALSVGEDGLISEPAPLASVLKCLPIEVGGLKKHTVVHSCLHATKHLIALGSEQGYVWVLDLSINKLLREYSDLKGCRVTAVRLNPVQDHIAYGTTQGLLRVESITKPLAKRYTIREKDDQPLSALAWSRDGCYLYSGYLSGRLLKFHFQFKNGMMEATPLLECGSQVVQLSVCGTRLLISTLARSLLMDADSGRLTQVGMKERKPGAFGGSFSLSGERAYLIRPGLRVWMANEEGKVLHTAKFRDIFLTSKHLPRIMVQSWPMAAVKFTETWQFSLLFAWMDRYIVTLHDKTLWVLDPEALSVAGILCVEHKITGVCPSGEDLFVLCGGVSAPLIRLSFSPRVSETSILNPEAMAFLLSEQLESPASTRESKQLAGDETASITSEVQGKPDEDGQEKVEEKERDKTLAAAETSKSAGLQVDEEVGSLHAVIDEGDTTTISSYDSEAHPDTPYVEPNSHAVDHGPVSTPPPELAIGEKLKAELKDVKELLMPALGKLSGIFPHHHHPKAPKEEGEHLEMSQQVTRAGGEGEEGEKEEIDGEEVREGDKESLGEPTLVTVTPAEQPEPGKAVDLKGFLKLGKLSGLRRSAPAGERAEGQSPAQSPKIVRHTEVDVPGSPLLGAVGAVQQLDFQERERRLRMAQATKGRDDDVVVGGKGHGTHKKKKKRRSKKSSVSSRSSSASVSMERLDQISELDEQESVVSSHGTPTTPTQTVEGADQPALPADEEGLKGTLVGHGDVAGTSPDPTAFPHSLDQWIDGDIDTTVPTHEAGQEEAAPKPEDSSPSSSKSDLQGDDQIPASPRKFRSQSERLSQQPLFDDEEDAQFELFKEDATSLPPRPSQRGLQLLEDTPPHSPSDVTLVGGQHSVGEELLGRSFPSYVRRTADTRMTPAIKTGSRRAASVLVESVDDPLYMDEESEGTHFDWRRKDVRITVEPPSDSSESHKSGSSHVRSSVERTPSEDIFGLSSDAAQFEHSGSGEWFSSAEGLPTCRIAPGLRFGGPRPLTEDSDSSHEDNGQGELECSVMAPDFYKLCDAYTSTQQRNVGPDNSLGLPDKISLDGLSSDGLSEAKQSARRNSDDKGSASDIWVPIPHPSRHSLQSVCLSDQLLWVVDSQATVFYTTTNSKGKDWQRLRKPFHQIASSPSGNVVWAVYQQNAYVKLGVGMSPTASIWRNVTRSSLLAKTIKQIAVDETAVWAVKSDGQVLFRKDVSESNPEGKVWKEVGHAAGFNFVACCGGIVWVLTTSGKVFIREGITMGLPSGHRWVEVKAPNLSAVSITSSGIVWGLSQQDSSLGFRCGVSKGRPMGKGPWWEVSFSALAHPTSPYNSLWQVMTSEGSQILAPLSSFAPLSTLGSLVSFPSQPKLMSITASRTTGVCVLESGNKLHACWKSATGYHYTPASKDGVFQLTTWSKLAVTSTGLWVVREDGELFCVSSEDKLVRIECESNVTLITASPSVLWVVTRDKIWSRQGMSPQTPEGFSWDYIELSSLLDDAKLRHIVCGNQAVWAIDGNGTPYFRFGVHSREPGTGMSPAWIPVDDNKPLRFLHIAVSSDNWLVWSCDQDFNAYVRTGVTQDYPVGLAWEPIPDERIKFLCAACGKIYALTPSGELLCRHGITERNPQGNYWRRMPGKYASLATGPEGDLWTLDEKGVVWKQESKVLPVSLESDTSQGDFEMSMVVDPTWEML